MAKLSPQEYADKWAKRLKAAGPEISQGIDRVKTAPGVKAAAQSDLMRSKINESLDQGVWQARVAAVPLGTWQQQTKTKGVPRIAAGVDGAAAGQVQMAGKLLAAVDRAVQEVEKTPRGDLQTNITRMVTFAMSMAAEKIK